MPADKQTRPNTSKPLTPALSANFRTAKSPLTPRVVGSASSSPNLTSRREPFVRSKSPPKPDQTTTPLNGNITPRSGARKSRVGTESPLTPAQARGTGNGQRPRASSGNEASKPTRGAMRGLGLTSPRLAASTGALPKANTSGSTSAGGVHRRLSAAKSMIEGDKDIASKFFHADEVKPVVGSPDADEGHRFPPKPGHFFVGSPPLTRENSSGKENLDDKFFRANDLTPHGPARRNVLPHISTERLTSPAVTTAPHGFRNTPPQSPNKVHRGVPLELPSPRKPQPGQSPSPPGPRTTAQRPKSSSGSTTISQPTPKGHRKSISASSIGSPALRRLSNTRAQAPQPLDLHPTPSVSPRIHGNNLLSPETLSPRSISLASTNTVPTSVLSDIEFPEATKTLGASAPSLDPKTDQATTSVPSQLDQAANARRERKVLDLEISNSSLLAINKTLERELRKQTGELRRYRRLSRSGRLSLAPTTRTTSEQSNFTLDTVTEFDDEDRQFSDNDDSDLDDLDDEDGSMLSNESGSMLSPSIQSRQRARDEKRLMQDLSRHQQLLIDFQKLSQSIKRCLTCSEELIREGNKALDYRVGIGDVKLGGRVLNDDELDERGLVNGVEEQEARQGLLSPSITKANLDEAQLWEAESPPPTITASEVTAMPSLDELSDILNSVSAQLGETSS
ncbi:uncharacterized protein Z520_10464 [Fonsecaea multimorphosa CBS 102226]|uniref:Uncharacterized protein n=1 Tax=Fonsecaea multimorphosa CBS 102226 TaxID=1442371 RepID=A0A0D2JTM3_9EURO|nr:uncharacterized protein Z520_10464 [Fonsecaea multimorphosa CBS 102226]KIX93839.1 hypothetical protein Z520_10464 [Fonsecaea multimorphosa CBS 102226]OAL19079.1 hypothetical protein AYO22_10027 [Fonsecaea multimorphosa]